MNKEKHNIVIAVTGASGSVYARSLLKKLELLGNQLENVALIFSDNAKEVWKHELNDESYSQFSFTTYHKNDFYAPFASGSSQYKTMIICPCSMGTLARIANGVSGDLITRAADVMIKEKRRLILVARETPLSLIHINNMKTVTEAGGIICPASPSFYSKPKNIEEAAVTVVDRVLDLAGLDHKTYRWNQ